MICLKCQNNIADNSRFCEYCGNSFSDYQYYDMSDDSATLKPKKNHLFVVPIVSIVIVLIAVAAGIIIYNTPANKLTRTLNMARKYYSQEDYKSAVLAYKAVIAIDPKCEDAYLELIDTYTAAGEYENAVNYVDKSGKVLNSHKQQLKYKSIANTAIKKEKIEFLSDYETDDYRVNAYLAVAMIYAKDDKEKAIKYLKECIADLDNAEVLEAYLYTLSTSNNITEATINITEQNNTINVPNIASMATSNIKVIKNKRYYSSEITDYWDEYQYDSNGNVIKSIVYDSIGTTIYWEEYEYDVNGDKTKSARYISDGTLDYGFKYEYEYNANGKKVKSTTYDYSGNIKNETEYEYDNKGNLTKETINTPDGAISGWLEYEYDINGNKTKTVRYGINGTIYFWKESEYDANGNEIKFVEYNSDGTIISEMKYTAYSANGIGINQLSINGVLSNECEYDSLGRIIKATTNYNNETIIYEYEYY